MGFEVFGMRVWDFSQKFGYFEAFSGIIIVLGISVIGFLLLRAFRPQ